MSAEHWQSEYFESRNVEAVGMVVVVVHGMSGDIFISLHLISLCVFFPQKNNKRRRNLNAFSYL